MKLFWSQICACILLSLLTISLADRERADRGHRRKGSSKLKRRPIRPTTIGYRQTLHRQTTESSAEQSQEVLASPGSTSNSLIYKQVKDGDFKCHKRYEILVNPKNPSSYKMCVPVGQNWVTYSYTCPNAAVFDIARKRCVVVEKPQNKNPLEKINVPHPVSVSTNEVSKISNWVYQKPPASRPRPTTPIPTHIIWTSESNVSGEDPSNATELYSSSSSSEEVDSHTSPSEFDGSKKADYHDILKNKLLAQSQLIHDLLNRPNNAPPVPVQQQNSHNQHEYNQLYAFPSPSRPYQTTENVFSTTGKEVPHQATEIVPPRQTVTRGTQSQTSRPSSNAFVTWDQTTEKTAVWNYGENNIRSTTNAWESARTSPFTPQIYWKPTPTQSAAEYPARFPGLRPSST